MKSLMSIKNNLFLPERALKVFLTLLFSFLLVGEASAVKSYKGYSNLPEPPATTKGESIYRESDCSLCHGEMGDGEGFLAAGLQPKPRDFTSFLQMNTVPDMAMINAIRDGIKGTAMPAHPDFNDEQIDELICQGQSKFVPSWRSKSVPLGLKNIGY
jgi:cytochrome c